MILKTLLPRINSVFVIVLVLIAVYMKFGPVSTPVYFNMPFPVNGEMIPGGKIYYDIEYCKYKQSDALAARYVVGEEDQIQVLVSESLSAFPLTPRDCSKDKPSKIRLPITLPSNLKGGSYYLKVVVINKPNVLRTTTTEVRTDSFVLPETQQ